MFFLHYLKYLPKSKQEVGSSIDDDDDEDVEFDATIHNYSETDLLEVPYLTTGKVAEGSPDKACVYEYNSSVNLDGFSTTELLSLQLNDLMNEYHVPRECYRKLVRLFNTMIRDNEKIMQGLLYSLMPHALYLTFSFSVQKASPKSSMAHPSILF